jgi:response regulator RpfG family c-di-GMP phosphodiesterase
MTQILIIENDETLRKIIKLNLTKTLGSDVVEMSSSKEAIELLKILPEMDLIICREIIKNDSAGFNLAQYLIGEKLQTPLLVIGNKVSIYKHSFQVAGNADWRAVVEKVNQILKVGGSDAQASLPEYVPASIYYFMNINTIMSGCDIFIRVKKNDNDFQYVKRLHAGDHFSREDILRYYESGLHEFFIAKENFTQFVNFVTDDLVKKLSDQTIAGNKRITLSSDAYKVTQERINSIGVDEHTVKLVEESIASMTALLKEQNVLATFLKALKANECSYAYAHSYLCCLILHRIISKFDWQSPQIREKLAYIAYFHDISLNGSDLTEINALEDFNKSELRDEERKRVESHALESAKIVNKFDSIPSGVDTIIKEHHGSRTGIGFVENYSATLMPLSMMFIVTESFVDELLKVGGSPNSADMKNIFSKLQLRFNKSTYGQTLTALQNMVTTTKKT